MIDEDVKGCDLILLTDEKAEIVGLALTKKIEGCDATLSGNPRAA
jgi:hypothetical protein